MIVIWNMRFSMPRLVRYTEVESLPNIPEKPEPFAWTKKKVYQRRFKNRRVTQL